MADRSFFSRIPPELLGEVAERAAEEAMTSKFAAAKTRGESPAGIFSSIDQMLDDDNPFKRYFSSATAATPYAAGLALASLVKRPGFWNKLFPSDSPFDRAMRTYGQHIASGLSIGAGEAWSDAWKRAVLEAEKTAEHDPHMPRKPSKPWFRWPAKFPGHSFVKLIDKDGYVTFIDQDNLFPAVTKAFPDEPYVVEMYYREVERYLQEQGEKSRRDRGQQQQQQNQQQGKRGRR